MARFLKFRYLLFWLGQGNLKKLHEIVIQKNICSIETFLFAPTLEQNTQYIIVFSEITLYSLFPGLFQWLSWYFVFAGLQFNLFSSSKQKDYIKQELQRTIPELSFKSLLMYQLMSTGKLKIFHFSIFIIHCFMWSIATRNVNPLTLRLYWDSMRNMKFCNQLNWCWIIEL